MVDLIKEEETGKLIGHIEDEDINIADELEEIIAHPDLVKEALQENLWVDFHSNSGKGPTKGISFVPSKSTRPSV